MKNQALSRRNSQAGSVLLIILICVALFGALSAVMIQSTRTSGTTISQDKAKLAATTLLTYANSIQNTVQAMRIDGCTDAQISFQGSSNNPSGWNYTNASTTTACKVFDPSGGHMNFLNPIADVAPTAIPAFVGVHCYEGVGSGLNGTCDATNKELEYNLIDIPREICIEINRSAEIGTDGAEPPTDNYSASPAFAYQGTYSAATGAAATISIGASGKKYGCYKDNAGAYANEYMFFYILRSN